MRVGRGVGVRVGLLTTSLAALLALAACDGGEAPTDPPSSSETTTAEETTEPTTTPSATPPEVEAPTPAPEASVDDHVGAIWAARYFLDLYVYMLQTGDSAQFEAMSSPDCEFCEASLERANDLHDDGSWLEGGGIEFDIADATAEYPTDSEPNYLVRFSAVEQPSVVHNADGSIQEREGSSFDSVIAVRFVEDRFMVSGVNAE